MAQEVPISGGPETAKIRDVVGVPVLIFFTVFVYLMVWWYKINRELADLGRKHNRTDLGKRPVLSMLAIFPGMLLLLVPMIWTTVTTYQRAKRAQQLVGVEPHNQMNPWIYGLTFAAFAYVTYGYLQNELNKVWRIDSGQVAAAATAPPPPPPTAPPPPPPGS